MWGFRLKAEGHRLVAMTGVYRVALLGGLIWGLQLRVASSILITAQRPNTTVISFHNEITAQQRTIDWGIVFPEASTRLWPNVIVDLGWDRDDLTNAMVVTAGTWWV